MPLMLEDPSSASQRQTAAAIDLWGCADRTSAAYQQLATYSHAPGITFLDAMYLL